MALNFPNSPTDGQVYTDTPSGNRWVWDSANTVWKATSTFTQTITVASTAPGTPVVGQLWWNQDFGRLLVYYNDGTSSQWVDASPSDYTSGLAFNKANNALANTTGTFAGNLNISGTSSINNVIYSPYGTMKNRIINGDFRIDQRFSGAANNNITGNQYVVDRWGNYASAAGKIRFQQNNTNGPGQAATRTATGFDYYFGANTYSANTVSAGDAWILYQAIEGINVEDLNWGTSSAANVTLSFWSYSSIAGTHGIRIANGSQDRSYPATYTINTANTWQYQTITIPGDTTGSWWTNNNIGMWVMFPYGVGSGSDGTNNTWQSGGYYPSGVVKPVASSNGSFYLTGVQLEKGNQATTWDWRHYTTELALCQRYFVSSLNSPNSYKVGWMGIGSGNYAIHGVTPFPVTMRSNPSVTAYAYGLGAGTAQELDGRTNVLAKYTFNAGNSYQSHTYGLTPITTTNAIIAFNCGDNSTQGATYSCGYTASAELNVQN